MWSIPIGPQDSRQIAIPLNASMSTLQCPVQTLNHAITLGCGVELCYAQQLADILHRISQPQSESKGLGAPYISKTSSTGEPSILIGFLIRGRENQELFG